MADQTNKASSNGVSVPDFSNPLLQMYFLTPEQKADKKQGKTIAQAIYKKQTSSNDNLNFFLGRKARWTEILMWAKGSQPMQEFLNYMSVSDANKSFVSIDMTQQRIAAMFVQTLVESLAKNILYPSVSAIDDGSINEKEQRMWDALFRMHDKEFISQMQQQSGLQLELPTAYVPQDELSARVYFEIEDRLPKEIRFEKLLKKTLNDIKFDRVINRKGLYDIATVNFEATKIEKTSPNTYTVRKCIPTNCIYNFFINDTGGCELTQFGEFFNFKVKDVRSRYGKSESNPNGLTEKEIFSLAKLSTEKNIGTFNYQWNDVWGYLNYNQVRPYDDCSILIFDFEVDCGENFFAVEKTDNYGNSDIQVKTNAPYQQKKKDGTIIEQPKPDNVNIIKRQKNTWMHGVYAPYGDIMVCWNEPDLIINPYGNVYKSLSSYSVVIPNNDGDYVPSIFERIMEPLREYTLTKLKRKHLISQLKPSGIRVDVESARNIDLGNGNTISWEEVLRIYNQTGTELWSSKGIDPLRPEMPALSNTVADTSIQKIVECTNVMNAIVQEIRDLTGISLYVQGGDLGDRTAAKLAEGQTENASNVNGYVLNAHVALWEETCYKLTCLHWNDIVKTEPESANDLINTRFDVAVKMKMADYERELIEADIQRYSQVPDSLGQPAISPKDAMMIREIDNFKLARLYMTNIYEENLRRAAENKQKDIDANGKVQMQTAQYSAAEAAKLQDQKVQSDEDMKRLEGQQAKELALLTGFMQVAAKDETGQLIKLFMPALQQLVPNVALPLASENKQMQQEIIQSVQAEMAHNYASQQMQQEQPQQQPEMQPESQPQ